MFTPPNLTFASVELLAIMQGPSQIQAHKDLAITERKLFSTFFLPPAKNKTASCIRGHADEMEVLV